MTRNLLTETGALVEESGAKPGRLNIQIITPGWGSSGYYSADVLEAAATNAVFPAGTQMFIDHPTEEEDEKRPGRSVKDLAAVLETDAVWNGAALVAEARTFGPYRDLVAEMKDAIGVSIRATAEVSEGEAEGRSGIIVERLAEARSVDFVTAAGRGGKILDVLESARETVIKRAMTRGVTEATANETREQLQAALTDKLGGEKIWIWVRDFDDTTVWYEHETPDSSGTFQLAYTLGETGPAELDGDPVEVRAQTTYTPITTSSGDSTESQASSPAGETDQASDTGDHASTDTGATTDTADATEGEAAPAAETAENTTSPVEGTMTETKGAGTPAPAGSSRQVFEAQLAAQHREIVEMKARDKARGVIAEDLADAFLSPRVVARLTEELLTGLPIVNDELDIAALRDRVAAKRDAAEAEAGELLQLNGAGQVRGLGASTAQATESAGTANFQSRATDAFKALGLSESAAQIAAKGR